MASACRMRDMRGMRPLAFDMLCDSTPIAVPMVSNMSRKSIDTTHTSMSMEKISLLHSILQKRGMGEVGMRAMLSMWVRPMGMPMMVVATMLKKMAPWTFNIINTPDRRRQMANSCFSGSVTMLAREMMAELGSVNPALFIPSEARKKPTPTPMALRSEMGMHSTMIVRKPENDSSMNSSPSMKMAVRAKCHE